MTIERTDAPDLVSYGPLHEPEALASACHALGAAIVTSFQDKRWTRTGEHGDLDPIELMPTKVIGWRHEATAVTLGIETSAELPILGVTLDPESGLEGDGCTVRVPRDPSAADAPEPVAALREAYTTLRLIAALSLIQTADETMEPDLWGRGIAALVRTETGRDVTTVTLPTPVSGPRPAFGALHPGARPIPGLIVTDRDMRDIDHPLVNAIAAVVPTTYRVTAFTRVGGRPEVDIHAHRYERTDDAEMLDPLGEMRAIAHVRAALDAAGPA